ncbi:nicotinate-nucleotide--dimethylbenzimidazole phosphoribosyltransferase [Desulfamplus magnetovallimortis]|nr:nicotinate-nucleotide--dimethylbenzimidazole phosphoribosyltransferase [Desulfamplus magnetovallimortis]
MKRLILKGLEKLDIEDAPLNELPDDFRLLKVLYCAICKTDAKMWKQGHRDLCFPRVPGHEMVVEDDSGNLFAVWPGQSCGQCSYCINGRENLCEDMKITGFHHDGGFAEFVALPKQSLLPLPDINPLYIGCFAEPAGCVFNALDKLELQTGERVIIYGGGTVGLVAALACRDRGAVPLVIEKHEEKIDRIRPFLDATAIECVKDTFESDFDAVINACADHIAFDLAIVKGAKGGRISFFSGLSKNEHIETNLVNLIHYKELKVTGSYGLTRKNMMDAIPFMEKNAALLGHLVEDIVTPDAVSWLLPDILAGKALKYIIDFQGRIHGRVLQEKSEKSSAFRQEENKDAVDSVISDQSWCDFIISSVSPVRQDFRPAVQGKIDNKTKPLGALGTLENLAIQMSLIQKSLLPEIRPNGKALFVFAGDHGVTEEGVSAYPSEVTHQMVLNFLNGGAAINVLCRHHNIEMKIVDMGVNGNFDEHHDLITAKIRKGTRNFTIEPAMTRREVLLAVRRGMEVFLKRHSLSALDIVGVGEMGIGNTTSASAIISVITGISPADAAGRGTGIDNRGLEHKIKVIEKAIAFHRPNSNDGFDILMRVGGYEIAGITGAVLAAASRGAAVLLDGVISTAAGLVAYVINPDIAGYLISGHKSVEVAQKAALDYMGLEPVIDFGMRLGEGTGAALTINTAEAACKIMCEMASFEDAKVAMKKKS